VSVRLRYILLYGLLLGLALAGLKLFEYSVYTRSVGLDAYGGIIAVVFLAVGLIVGVKSRRQPGRSDTSTEAEATALRDAGGVPRNGDVASTPRRRDPGLSHRELEVLSHVATGKTNNEIAEALFVSPNTVKSHVSSIYRKLDVERRAHAVARAKELRLIG